MKKILFSVLVLAFVLTTMQGQVAMEGRSTDKRHQKMEERKEALKAKKIGYITSKLEFSPEEAQKFWPLYNTYENNVIELKRKIREQMRSLSVYDDKEAYKVIQDQIQIEQQILDLKREFMSDLENVLSLNQIVRLHEVEQKFKKEVLDKVKRRMRDR